MIPKFLSGDLWLQITGSKGLLFTLLSLAVNLVVMVTVFYVAGVLVVGKRRAFFSDAFVISLLGTVVGNVCLIFFPPLVGLVLSFFVWLLLIRYYYETEWFGSFAVAILALVVYSVIWIILSILLGIPLLLFAGLASL